MSVVNESNSEPLIKNEKNMRYRPFGNTGLEVSALSFGCMRLQDDEALNKELISTAIDLGVNYFETTRGYLGGTCQHRTAPGLKNKTAGVIVSGKDGINENKTEYQYYAEIENQLNILGLSHFKFYQVGWFSWGNMPHLLKTGGVLDAIRRAKKEGLIQHVGFTGHDTPDNFIKCIETGLFDSLTIPYSLVNRMYEPTIQRAGELGIGVVAMCPVAGGMLSFESDQLKEVLGMDMPTTEMALRFVLANPNVSTACSGMSTLKMLQENVKTVHAFDPTKGIEHAQMCEGLDKMIEKMGTDLCTNCRYCMPCPQKVNIPHHMNIHKNVKCFGLETWGEKQLSQTPKEESSANCNECGVCEEKCPNNLKIRDILKELSAGMSLR